MGGRRDATSSYRWSVLEFRGETEAWQLPESPDQSGFKGGLSPVLKKITSTFQQHFAISTKETDLQTTTGAFLEDGIAESRDGFYFYERYEFNEGAPERGPRSLGFRDIRIPNIEGEFDSILARSNSSSCFGQPQGRGVVLRGSCEPGAVTFPLTVYMPDEDLVVDWESEGYRKLYKIEENGSGVAKVEEVRLPSLSEAEAILAVTTSNDYTLWVEQLDAFRFAKADTERRSASVCGQRLSDAASASSLLGAPFDFDEFEDDTDIAEELVDRIKHAERVSSRSHYAFLPGWEDDAGDIRREFLTRYRDAASKMEDAEDYFLGSSDFSDCPKGTVDRFAKYLERAGDYKAELKERQDLVEDVLDENTQLVLQFDREMFAAVQRRKSAANAAIFNTILSTLREHQRQTSAQLAENAWRTCQILATGQFPGPSRVGPGKSGTNAEFQRKLAEKKANLEERVAEIEAAQATAARRDAQETGRPNEDDSEDLKLVFNAEPSTPAVEEERPSRVSVTTTGIDAVGGEQQPPLRPVHQTRYVAAGSAAPFLFVDEVVKGAIEAAQNNNAKASDIKIHRVAIQSGRKYLVSHIIGFVPVICDRTYLGSELVYVQLQRWDVYNGEEDRGFSSPREAVEAFFGGRVCSVEDGWARNIVYIPR